MGHRSGDAEQTFITVALYMGRLISSKNRNLPHVPVLGGGAGDALVSPGKEYIDIF